MARFFAWGQRPPAWVGCPLPRLGIGHLTSNLFKPGMAYFFPAGGVGAALLLMRIQAAIFASQWAFQVGTARAWSIGALAFVGLGIFAGIFTRLAATLFAFVTIASVLRGILSPSAVWQTFDLAALSLAGAGAYSMDAWLFGRRVIRFRP